MNNLNPKGQNRRYEKTNVEVCMLTFLIGTVVGGTLGTCMMCILQASGDHSDER